MIMSWDELRVMAADPLVHIGAHTKDHFAVAKLPETDALEQMVGSADRIKDRLQAWKEAAKRDDVGSLLLSGVTIESLRVAAEAVF